MRSVRLSVASLGLLLFVACVGCGSGAALYPVTGTVTYQDKGVEGATVQFVPNTDGVPVSAITDASGKFTLMTGGKPGAAAGDYKVTVNKVTGGASAPANPSPEDMKKIGMAGGMKSTSALPAQYSSITTTTLTATIKSGENDVPLVLK